MGEDYTTTEIIASLKKRGVIPTSQKTFQNSDFIRFMNEELRLQIVPMLISLRENYFLGVYDQAIVDGKNSYDIPPRAIGTKVKNVYFLDAQNRPFELPRIDYDDLTSLQNPNPNLTGIPRYFYFQDNDVVIVPSPSGVSGYIRMPYYVRRNQLVDVTEVGRITAINTGTGLLSLNNVPTTFTTSVQFDLVKGSPGFQNLTTDLTPSSVGTADITFAPGSLPSTLATGDYVCLAQQTPIPQIPLDVFPLLVQRTLVRVLRGINDLAGSKNAQDDLVELEKAMRVLLSDRADEQTKKIFSANGLGQWVLGRYTRW